MRLTALEEGFLCNGLPETIGAAALFTGDPFDLAELRARVGERWGALERMSRLPEPSRTAALLGHRWSAPAPFDAAAHVTACAQELEPLLTASVTRRLPTDRPLWRLLVPEPTPSGEQPLLLLAHHALLDGSSLLTLLRLLMDDLRTRPPAPLTTPPRERPRVPAAALLKEWRDSNARGRHLPLAPGEPQASVAVARLDPDVMRSARRRPSTGRGATLNELLLGAFAGALPTCYDALASPADGDTPLFATVPMDLRARHETDDLGNLITAIRVPLPLGADTPAGRLHACQHLLAALQERSRAHHVVLPILEGVTRVAPWLTATLARRIARPEVTTAVCTAFKWRDGPSRLHGRRLNGIVTLPALSPPGTANLGLAQHGDTYLLTVVSHLRPADSRLIADTVAKELTAMAFGGARQPIA